MTANVNRTTFLTGLGLGLGLAGRAAGRRLRASDLHGQVALITEGSRGLGFLLARELAGQGCRVAICARDARELENARSELERQGADVLALTCDVADEAQVQRMVDDATRHFGRIDILVNNAGIIQAGPFGSMTRDDFREAMDVMFWGVLHPTLAVLPQMRERRSGRIVNITSFGGKVGVPHLIPYGCAKFAATGLSEGLRAELAPEGISVTTVVPGLLRTGSFLNAFFKGPQEQEYALFAPAAALPLLSMDAERAARQIVQATRRGQAELILTLPAAAAVRFHGLFPGTTANVLGAIDRFLPGAEGNGTGRARGRQIDRRLGSGLLERITTFGRSAAERFNE